MSSNRETIAEIIDDRHTAVFRRVNRKNGHNNRSGLLSWYFAQPRNDGLRYVLTANGYVIVPAGLLGSREDLTHRD